jgi:SAM-dependent methyltransferase
MRRGWRTRQPDPRVAAAIRDALGDVGSVLNIGTGAGAYEPPQTVRAVKPSRVTIDQRPAGAAPAVEAVAAALPLPDEATLAVLTVHHWSDVAAGVAEMRRVARGRAVFFAWWPERVADFWLLRDYLPAAAETDARLAVQIEELARLLGADAQIRSVPVPHDCVDGESLQRLEADVRTGAWHRADADLVHADSLDVGYCTVAVDL